MSKPCENPGCATGEPVKRVVLVGRPGPFQKKFELCRPCFVETMNAKQDDGSRVHARIVAER